MSLTDRYVDAVKKKVPKDKRESVERELRAQIKAKMDEMGGDSEEIEEEVLREMGNPRLQADKYSGTQHFLIGPELYSTYLAILRVVVIVAVAGSFIGITVDSVFNEKAFLSYAGSVVSAAISAAIGSFGWITLVFAVLERKAKEEILKEIKDEWNPRNLPEEKAVPKPFSNLGVTIEICFIVLAIILINGYMGLFRVYYSLDDLNSFVTVLNMDIFQTFVPYINGVLALQLLLAGSKLAFKKWTYPIATANFAINMLSLALVFAVLGSSDIINLDLIEGIKNISSDIPELTQSSIDYFFASIKIAFAVILSVESIQGFYNAYKNRG